MSKNESGKAVAEVFEGDGFTIDNGIIKGELKHNELVCKPLAKSILKSLNDASDNIAQIDPVMGKTKSFKDVKEHSIRLALWMKKEGINSGDIVTVCSPNHSDVEIIIISTFFVDAIYNAFPHDLDLTSARRYVKLIKPRIIFLHKNQRDILQRAAELENENCKIIVLEHLENSKVFDDELSYNPSSDEIDNFQVTIKDVNPKNVCAIMPTSGTTGNPKFVCISHQNVISRMSHQYNIISPPSLGCKESRYINNIALIHLCPEWSVYVRYVLLHLLLKNTKIYVADLEPREIFHIIEKYKVNSLISSSYKVMLYCNSDDAYKYDLKSVTAIHASGLQLPTGTIEKMHKIFPNARFRRSLGSTETGTMCRYTEKCINPKSQGTVVPNVQLKIINADSGKILKYNEVGEICIKSPSIMTGYFGNPTETALMYDDEGWFHTGDEAYYDENGEIIVVGRLKELIKYRDTDVNANYVEELLMSHSEIIEAAVVGIPHDLYGEQPVACIKTVEGSQITDKDILELTSGLQFSDTFKSSIFFVDKIPRTTNGKINKRVLKEQLLSSKRSMK